MVLNSDVKVNSIKENSYFAFIWSDAFRDYWTFSRLWFYFSISLRTNATQLSSLNNLCRLYTGIHAKAKPKFKTAAISESTTALNVDQTNVDQSNTSVNLSSVLAPPAAATKGAHSQDQTTIAAVPTTNSGSTTTLPPQAAATTQKEAGLAKLQADKKKMDARKKSLKRLWYVGFNWNGIIVKFVGTSVL